ncbi:hypothetical protein QJS66_00165 [Kocuria rhizophila]|nr:hypothetical protein QJS66_00165 [Kocuria rhizophila]
MLDESIRTAPFSRTVLQGARRILRCNRRHSEWRSEKGAPQLTVIRATSVMGSERRTTRRLARFASCR